MDFELKVLMRMTKVLPPVKGAGLLGNLARRFYCRKNRQEIVSNVLGFNMILNPCEWVDGGLLFFPQIYDYRERIFLKRELHQGGIFLDIGAYIGFYSLIASRSVGETGKVLSIEADPYNFNKLKFNIKQNNINNIIPINAAVSDKNEILKLGINVKGNRGGNSFLDLGYMEFIDIQCVTLLELLEKMSIKNIDIAKLDIEGFEFRVLNRFFQESASYLYPNFIIVEHHPEWIEKAGGNTLDLLAKKGYRKIWSGGWKGSINYIFKKVNLIP